MWRMLAVLLLLTSTERLGAQELSAKAQRIASEWRNAPGKFDAGVLARFSADWNNAVAAFAPEEATPPIPPERLTKDVIDAGMSALMSNPDFISSLDQPENTMKFKILRQRLNEINPTYSAASEDEFFEYWLKSSAARAKQAVDKPGLEYCLWPFCKRRPQQPPAAPKN